MRSCLQIPAATKTQANFIVNFSSLGEDALALFTEKTSLFGMQDQAPIIKHREIVLRGPSDPSLQVDNALLLLADVDGMVSATKLSSTRLSISYDLRLITLEQIETAMGEVGYHLDASIMSKLKRALYYYTEDNERMNLGLDKISCSNGCAIKVFVNHYRKTEHGCRDQRPEHVKHYF